MSPSEKIRIILWKLGKTNVRLFRLILTKNTPTLLRVAASLKKIKIPVLLVDYLVTQ